MGHPGGPTLYKPEYCKELIEHMSGGLSYESFGGVIRVSRTTLYNWEEQFEDWAEAKEIGVACSQLFWERTAVEGLRTTHTFDPMTGQTTVSKVDAAILIFNLKARFGFRDRPDMNQERERPPIQLLYAIGEKPPEHPNLYIVAPLAKAANE